jgi:hypothetical protein
MSKRVLKGYDGSRYQVGDRVEVHPSVAGLICCTDLDVRGARYGVVTGTSPPSRHFFPVIRVQVELDIGAPGRTFSASEGMFRALEPRKDWSEVDRIVRRIDRQKEAESDPKVYHSHPPQYGRLEPGCLRCLELSGGARARVGRGWRD